MHYLVTMSDAVSKVNCHIFLEGSEDRARAAQDKALEILETELMRLFPDHKAVFFGMVSHFDPIKNAKEISYLENRFRAPPGSPSGGVMCCMFGDGSDKDLMEMH